MQSLDTYLPVHTRKQDGAICKHGLKPSFSMECKSAVYLLYHSFPALETSQGEDRFSGSQQYQLSFANQASSDWFPCAFLWPCPNTWQGGSAKRLVCGRFYKYMSYNLTSLALGFTLGFSVAAPLPLVVTASLSGSCTQNIPQH